MDALKKDINQKQMMRVTCYMCDDVVSDYPVRGSRVLVLACWKSYLSLDQEEISHHKLIMMSCLGWRGAGYIIKL